MQSSLFLVLVVVLSCSQLTAAAPERYNVSIGSNPWVTIRNAPGDFCIGNAAPGWHVDVTYRDSSDSWYYGYVYGDYNGCAWILAQALVNDNQAGNAYCSSSGTTFPQSAFGSLFNTYPTNDGAPVALVADADEYANVDPLGPDPAPRDFVRTRSAGQTVNWRYVTNDNNWVMIRDPAVADGDGNWVFIARSSLPSVLPYQSSV